MGFARKANTAYLGSGFLLGHNMNRSTHYQVRGMASTLRMLTDVLVLCTRLSLQPLVSGCARGIRGVPRAHRDTQG